MRIFILGIDSATFDIILPLVEQGRMPSTEKLIKQGVWGKLLSTHPPMTPPAWTSFMTGRRPENHGIFDFWQNDMLGPKYKRKGIGSADIKCHTIFRMLDFHGKKSLVVGMPMTYPPFQINGALVSGFMTPSDKSNFTYPKDLKTELFVRFGDYVLDPKYREYDEMSEDDFIKNHFSSDQSKVQAAGFLMDSHKDWDLLSITFSSLDHVQHYFWKYIDPLHPEYDSEKGKSYKRTIELFYIRHDDYLKGFLERLTPDDTVLIVSDHGAGPTRVAFHIDSWLERNGYLRNSRRVALKNRLKLIHWGIADSLRGSLGLPEKRRTRLKGRILHKKTHAFSGHQFEMGIYLNEKGKRPAGTVNSGGEYDALRADLISSLKEIKDPRSGEYVFEWVKPREEVYDGGFSRLAPDILFQTKPGCKAISGLWNSLFDYNPKLSGGHEPEGIFIASGPAIKENYRFESAHITDVAPTLLYLSGLPIDGDLDGRLLEEIIRDEYMKNHPPEFVKYSEVLDSEDKGSSYTEDEEEIMRKKLEGLGYL